MSFPDTLLPAISGDALEMDELVIRFRYKGHYKYLWLAISRLTHQVIGFWIGDRSFSSLWQFWFSLPAAYRRKLVYTDFYEAYAKLFVPWQHRPCDKGSGKTSLVEDQPGGRFEQQVAQSGVGSGEENRLCAAS